MSSVVIIGGGVGLAFSMTCLGAAIVFFFRKPAPERFQQIFLGLAAGVMIAASIWSLLIPAIEEAKTQGLAEWIPAAAGFVLGVLFLLGLDHLIPHLHPLSDVEEGPASKSKRTTLLIAAATLHNIPEGLALGLTFALAAQHSGELAMYASAFALALGLGIQNFPETAAVAISLRQEGFSSGKSFRLACMSGALEPVFAFLAVFFAAWIVPIVPWLLSFSAGAMIYVVVEELIPAAHVDEHSHAGTLGFMAGFLLMMILGVALG